MQQEILNRDNDIVLSRLSKLKHSLSSKKSEAGMLFSAIANNVSITVQEGGALSSEFAKQIIGEPRKNYIVLPVFLIGFAYFNWASL